MHARDKDPFIVLQTKAYASLEVRIMNANGKTRGAFIFGLATIAILLHSGPDVKADFIFGQPMNLGQAVNTENGDTGPSISADGLTLYFCDVPFDSSPAGYGGQDSYRRPAEPMLSDCRSHRPEAGRAPFPDHSRMTCTPALHHRVRKCSACTHHPRERPHDQGVARLPWHGWQYRSRSGLCWPAGW